MYIAFYDEYVGRHINTSAGCSLLFFIPVYLYGINVNRICEQNANHYLYNWTHFDKRNRLTHNLVMEHFDVHKEQMEDLIKDMNDRGPKVFADIPREDDEHRISKNEFALLDEMSGITTFLDNFMLQHDMPETSKERIKALMFRYESPVPRQIALNQMRIEMFGDQR